MPALIVLFLIIFLNSPAKATEPDPFACNNILSKAKKSADSDLNALMDYYLNKIQKEFKNADCSKSQDLHEALRDYIHGSFFSVTSLIEKKIEDSIEDDYRSGRKKRKLGYYCKPLSVNNVTQKLKDNAQGLFYGLGHMGFRTSIKLCGKPIGLDKIGHLTNQGAELFNLEYHKRTGKRHQSDWLIDRTMKETFSKNIISGTKIKGSTSLENALLHSYYSEFGIYGPDITGVVSYADMATNFSGLLFWNHLFKKNTEKAYFKCSKGKIIRTQMKFNWCDYITDLWDESINCSEVAEMTSDGEFIRLTPMSKFAKKKCPVDEKRCISAINQLKKQLGPKLEKLIYLMVSPSCIKIYNKSSDYKISIPNHAPTNKSPLAPSQNQSSPGDH